MRLRSTLARLGLTATLAVTAMVAVPATHANAGCLRTVGTVEQLWNNAVSGWGGHIADFYQGYDQCSHQAYAEMHFWNSRVPGSAAGTNNFIAIETEEWTQFGWGNDGHGVWNTNDPWVNNAGYPYWWDAGKYPISGAPGTEIFKAAFDFTYDAPDGTHHCYGESWWNYNNGSVPVSPSWNCPY